MKCSVAASLAAVAALGLCACATAPDEADAEPQWAAIGWLSPGRSGEPEAIGTYVTREECQAAVDDWMSRQVVGNPVSGECLPLDRH